LNAVVANSRFLILPQVKVPHLASHVLGLCARQLPEDWAAHYGVRPLLVETFVEHGRFRGTSYRAANWQHVGSDTTSLNYNTQPAIENLGPVGSRADTWLGLLVHDTMAFTPEGLPLGLVDVQVWARDAREFGQKHQRTQLPIEQKESDKWLKSVAAAARLQARCGSGFGSRRERGRLEMWERYGRRKRDCSDRPEKEPGCSGFDWGVVHPSCPEHPKKCHCSLG
jgi:hypothetical protein